VPETWGKAATGTCDWVRRASCVPGHGSARATGLSLARAAADTIEMSSIWHAGPAGRSDTVEVASSVWMRNGRRTRAWGAVAILWSVVFATLLFRPTGPNQYMTTVGYLVIGVFYLGIAGLGLALAGRVARAGLWIGPDGIVVRGPFTTHSVALLDAGLFVPGLQGRGGNGTPCPLLERQDRRAVGVWALGRRNVWFRYERLCQEIQPLCDELNSLVASLRSRARS
jgi:hypothetical protein